MNELEKYKWQKAHENAEWNHSEPELTFRKGFDTAIALDLPVKFANWLWLNVDEEEMSKTSWKDLYKYWIENVYKPE